MGAGPGRASLSLRCPPGALSEERGPRRGTRCIHAAQSDHPDVRRTIARPMGGPGTKARAAAAQKSPVDLFLLAPLLSPIASRASEDPVGFLFSWIDRKSTRLNSSH